VCCFVSSLEHNFIKFGILPAFCFYHLLLLAEVKGFDLPSFLLKSVNF